MSFPKVTLLYSNGNLLQDVAALDGISALMGTGSTVGLLGVPKTVYNLDDAVTKGFTEEAEPAMYRHLKEFYGEVAGNQALHIMIVPEAMTMAQMLDNTNAAGAKKLLTNAKGYCRLLGVFRAPGNEYDGGEDFIDADVTAALNNSKVFAQARLAELAPIRVLIEGRVQNPDADNTLTPTTLSNGFAGAVLGGSLSDGSASVGLALGRAVKYGAQIKIGKVSNGPLSINTCYVGDKELIDVVNLEALHGAGFISFMLHPRKAGFYFGIDRMASTDDYRLLAYGRIVDKAAVVAVATYVEEIEGEVDTDDNGNMASYAITYLEQRVIQQIGVSMGSQISGVSVTIDPAQNIINTSRTKIKLRVRPKGYNSFIDIELGLDAPSVE
jgi:hypothetical protein